MGNNQTSEEKVCAYPIENTGIEGIETPHYRNVICLNENNGDLIESIWDVDTCHSAFMYGLVNFETELFLFQFRRSVNKYKRFPCVGMRFIDANGQRGEFEWETYNEVLKKMTMFGSGLKSLGLVAVRITF